MTRTLLFLFLPFLALAQETTTYSIDTLPRGGWQLTTIITMVRPDSTVYESKSAQRFSTRKEAQLYVKDYFDRSIQALEKTITNTTRTLAVMRTAKDSLLADLGRPALKKVEIPLKEVPKVEPVKTPVKKSKKKKQ